MKNQKRIYRWFGYRECDAFAAFLRKQSLKGWHFKEWKMGLVFERGEPRDVIYDVQVFPKGKEKDLKPEADAREYADYCEMAGWELVDGQKRFCIFRKCGETSVPIVTEEEKFQNVRAAEWRQWLSDSVGYALLAGVFLCQYVLWPVSAMVLYNNVIMFLVVIVLIRFLWRVMDGAWLLFWGRKQKEKLAAGEKVVYEKAGLQKHVFVSLRELLCLGILAVLAYQAGYGQLILPFALFVAVCIGIGTLFSYLRPKRENVWIAQALQIWVSVIAMLVIAFVIIIGDGYAGSSFESGVNVSEDSRQMEELPLAQEDYKSVEGVKIIAERFRQKNVFGEMFVWRIEYVPEQTVLSEEEKSKLSMEEIDRLEEQRWKEMDSLTYEIYQCKYPWMVEKVWNVEVKNRELEECTEKWGAVCAGITNSGCYYVKYEDAVWVIDAEERLSDEQIQIIREKLGRVGKD